jgi:phosphatidylinositol 4-kinase
MDLIIVVSDSFADRKVSLETAELHASQWLDAAMRECAEDIRSLLSTYIMAQEDSLVASDRGRLLAIQYAVRSSAREQPLYGEQMRDSSDAFVGELTLRHLQSLVPLRTADQDSRLPSSRQLLEKSRRKSFIAQSELKEKLSFYVARILDKAPDTHRLLALLVEVPFNIFSISTVKVATSLWARVVTAHADLQSMLLAEIGRCWSHAMSEERGIFSSRYNAADPFSKVMEYAPTDKDAIGKEVKEAEQAFEPHLIIIKFLASRVSSPGSTDAEGQKILLRLIRSSLRALCDGIFSTHIFCHEAISRLLIIGFKLKSAVRALGLDMIDDAYEKLLYAGSLAMFATPPRWAFGSDAGRLRRDLLLCNILNEQIRRDKVSAALESRRDLVQLLLKHDISKTELWLDPLSKNKSRSADIPHVKALLPFAWEHNPAVAIMMAQRFASPAIHQALRTLIIQQPRRALRHAHAAEYLLGNELPSDAKDVLKYLVYWAPVVPISAITYFLPAFTMHSLILQYAMRSLESHPVDVTFFYVPQIVQLLRHDDKGYVRRFIVETAKISQLFAHQIIWNFNANAYKDEDATVEDVIKPALDQTSAIMIRNLSGQDRAFYETEFRFFGEVTSISGKLKPYIKRSKPEKKAKIDEEMAKIKVEEGVYLPSNPDGVVVGIDRKSGRPLQSHAKAPFMATFKIRRERTVDEPLQESKVVTFEKMQSAIFKVGDDCRQDVLAIQLIATFRGIFNSIGLDLYVFPYRVTATAPGCGVIDVLPNSISRDMLGREAVNGLYDYFITSFGKPDTVAFQQARMNFVKSLAAYSVITYLLQFKDRHNGNIMYDNQGHILHIDFGFCFDIAPGGITFESAPFKLTTEMVAVLGGSEHTQSYKMFQELCIKAFLVSRQYSEKIIHLVTLMLESGLPCFKGQQTITNLRNRFHLVVSEQQASQVMLGLIAKSHENQRTVAYDVFQKMTNGIPH